MLEMAEVCEGQFALCRLLNNLAYQMHPKSQREKFLGNRSG